MTIAIDIDGTWTKDPSLWIYFYDKAVSSGHEVIIVTARNPTDVKDLERFRIPESAPKIFTAGEPKKKFCLNLGVEVNIWIDDTPSSIEGGLIINENKNL